MKKFYLLFCIILFSISGAQAQNSNMNWMLGVGCSPPTDTMIHLNFNTGLLPIVQTRPQPQAYNCDYNATQGGNNWYYWTLPNTRTTTVSDINGDVQFYVLANKVYDKNHNLMNGINNIPASWTNNWAGTYYKFLNYGSGSDPMIIPRKDSVGKYYVYYIDINLDPNALLGNVRRFSVDMNQNGGNGRITHINEYHEMFNVPYTNPGNAYWWGSNKMDYLPTNCDSVYWAICYGSNNFYSGQQINDSAFYAVRINPYTGSISSTKTFKGFNLQNYGYNNWDNNGAQSIRFSPWGNKLAVTLQDTAKTLYYLADFNNQTGVVSNFVELHSVLNNNNYDYNTGWYGYNSLNGRMDNRNNSWSGGWVGSENESNKMLEFSADGNRLYALVYGDSNKLHFQTNSYPYLYATTKGDSLVQWDISSNTPATIVASRSYIAISEPTKLRVQVNGTVYNGHHAFYELERAGDNKIYLLKSSGDTIRCNPYNAGFYRVTQDALGVIHNPENLGTACNFQNNYIKFDDSIMTYQLPNKVPTTLTKYRIVDSIVCGLDSAHIKVVPNYFIDSVTWNFGDAASGPANVSTSATNTGVHAYSGSGIFTITAYVHRPCSIDTVVKTVNVHPSFDADLGPDSTLCTNPYLLDVTEPGATYLWNNGLTAPTRSINTAGTYWVTVTKNSCKESDTVKLDFFPPTTVKLGNDTTICSNEKLTLNPGNAPAGSTFMWSNGSTNSTIQVNQPGTYSVAVTNYCGVFRDTIKLSVIPTPVVHLPADTTLCFGDTMHLTLNMTGVSYAWSNGDFGNSTVVNAAGNYSVKVTSEANNCVGRDTIKVDYLPNPNFDLGPDRTICEGDEVVLIMPVLINPSTYLWSDGDTTRDNAFDKKGTYYGMATNICGTQSDTINVNVNDKPKLTLPHDSTFCKFYPYYVHASNGGGNPQGYTWIRGDGLGDSVLVNREGWFIVSAHNDCGTSTDSMVVYERYCCDIAVPNAFSPDGDGVNDVLKPVVECEISNYRFEVFSRWGQQMFASSDINTGWDGKYNGTVQDIGTFIWTITYQVKGELTPTSKKGNVTLIR